MLSPSPYKKTTIHKASRIEDRLFLYSEAGIHRISPVSDNIIRVTYTERDDFSKKEKPGVINKDVFSDWVFSESEENISLKTSSVTVVINRNNASYSFFDSEGRELLKERTGQSRCVEEFESFRLAPGGDMKREKIKTADGEKEIVSEAQRVSDGFFYHSRQYFDWQEKESLYGFGQQEEGTLNLRGKTVYIHQANRKIAVPVLVSSLGYGILFDHYCPMIFSDTDFGSYIYSEAVDEIDYYFIFGGNMEGVVKGYRNLTGKASIPPRWAFGYIQSQERYENAGEIIDTVSRFRSEGIGMDCIVLDWLSWPDGQWGQKSFDEKRFPDPSGMMEKIHEMDSHLMISIWPNMAEGCDNHKEFAEKGLFLPGSNVYDAFNEEARELYWQQVSKGLFGNGIDAWWCDSSEPYTPEWMHKEKPESSRMYEEFNRQTGDHIRGNLINSFALFHAQSLYEGQRKECEEKRVLNLTRSSYTGQQRYGTVLWSGDTAASWDTYRNQIPAGLSFCASGLPYWTNDIGAFFVKKGDNWYWQGDYPDAEKDPKYCELYVRWLQWACFLPVFRAHGTDLRREPWNFKEAGMQFYDAIRDSIRLRYSLIAHLYSLAGLAWLRDESIIRMLAFDYPQDETAGNCTSQYMLGESMMICPVTEAADESGIVKAFKIYLPEGNWYDFYTGEFYAGGRSITKDLSLNDIPVFVKEGSIIPEITPMQHAYKGRLNESNIKIIFRIYPGKDAQYTLYDDEGDGYGYEKGDYSLYNIEWNDREKKLSAPGLNNFEMKVICSRVE